MSASASGPIGALLLIAPLAAIPVLAIVGLPQFAPVAASPAEEDDLDAVSLGSHAGETRPASATRRADDLFAPIGHSQTGDASGTASTTPRETPRTQDSGTSRLPYADRFAAAQDANGAWNAPPGALDGWELGSSKSSANPSPARDDRDLLSRGVDTATHQRPDADALNAGFDPDLLQSETPRGRPAAPEKRLPGADLAEQSPPPDNAAPNEAPGTGAATDMAQFYSKRGWLAAAARLRELGIRNYQLEWVIEDQRFVFWCTVPSGNDGRVSNRFEAQDEEPLYAVQKTLAEVESSLARPRR